MRRRRFGGRHDKESFSDGGRSCILFGTVRREPTSSVAISALLLTSGVAAAEPALLPPPRQKLAAPAHKAEIRPRPHGGEALWIDGRIVHTCPGVIASARWSPRGDALAALVRNQPGILTLVVSVPAEKTTMTWTLPETWERTEQIDWLGARRVAVSPKPLQPSVVVSWPSSVP
jgi:hypothetical protein